MVINLFYSKTAGKCYDWWGSLYLHLLQYRLPGTDLHIYDSITLIEFCGYSRICCRCPRLVNSLYVPRSLSSNAFKEICEYVISNADQVLHNFEDYLLIDLVDLNQFPTIVLKQLLDVEQIAFSVTRATLVPGRVLISTSPISTVLLSLNLTSGTLI